MSLHLQVVSTVEQLCVPCGGLARARPVVRHQVARDLARHARGGHDEAIAVLCEHFTVDPGTVVEALRISDGGELHQVLVPLQIASQQDQVVVRSLARTRSGPVASIARGDVGLHPDDRPDPLFARGLVEVPRSEHAAVVREGQGGHLQFLRLPNQVADAVSAVEERVLRVRVEVDEAHFSGSTSGSGRRVWRRLRGILADVRADASRLARLAPAQRGFC